MVFACPFVLVATALFRTAAVVCNRCLLNTRNLEACCQKGTGLRCCDQAWALNKKQLPVEPCSIAAFAAASAASCAAEWTYERPLKPTVPPGREITLGIGNRNNRVIECIT